MKVRYKSERVEVEVEGKDTKDVFTQLAGAIEVFGSTTCGSCDSKNTVPVTREVQNNHYFEMACRDCGASLAFGQRKIDGALYPRRKDKEGNYLNSNGWTKWKERKQQDQEIDSF